MSEEKKESEVEAKSTEETKSEEPSAEEIKKAEEAKAEAESKIAQDAAAKVEANAKAVADADLAALLALQEAMVALETNLNTSGTAGSLDAGTTAANIMADNGGAFVTVISTEAGKNVIELAALAADAAVKAEAWSTGASISTLSVAVTGTPTYALISATAKNTASAAVVGEANKVADVYSAATANKWQAHFFVDGQHIKPTAGGAVLGDGLNAATNPTSKSGIAADDYTALTFDTQGNLATVAGDPLSKIITYTNVALGGANGVDSSISVDPMTIKFDLTGTTELSSEYAVKDLYQDGIPVGNLTGIDIDDKGVVLARFSNGGFDILGKVVVSRFSNNQGLENAGGSIWRETIESGQAVAGQAGTGSFGLIESGALEGSNVDLSAELVHLIIAQQTYQANAQSISTEKTIMQTILQA